MMERATNRSGFVIADGLPLKRLYARFDAIARGRAPGNSSPADESVIERLAANQRLAEALGWSEFVLEHAGGTGRLELRGIPAPGHDRELVPDAIPSDVPEPTTESTPEIQLVRDVDGQIGGRLANVSWRSRMRWLDDGGR
jgi:hypothetical protein